MQTFEKLPPPVEGTSVPIEDSPEIPSAGSESRPRRRRSWVIGLVVLAVVSAGALAAVWFLMFRPVAEISATSFDVAEVVLAGDDIDVAVVLVNEGDADGDHEVVVLVDGVEAITEVVAVASGTDENVELSVAGLSPGTYQLTLDGHEDIGATVWVMTRPEIDMPESIVTGEALIVNVPLRNDGSAAVDHLLSLSIEADGIAPITQQYSIQLAPGAEEPVTAEFNGLAPGLYRLEVQIADWQSSAGAVRVLAPAEFETSAVETPPPMIDLLTNPDASVVVEVANVGDLTGSVLLQAALDGTVVEERNIEVAGGTSATETFVFTITTPGPHEVSVGDTVATFEANQIQRPDNGTVVFNDIGGGSNELTIVNNNTNDVFVVLAEPGEGTPPLLGVYVHGESSHTVYGIRQGTYQEYYSFGSAWCTFHEAFTQDATYGRFDDASEYDSSSTTYTTITLTFGATDGWSPTESVPEDSFPGR